MLYLLFYSFTAPAVNHVQAVIKRIAGKSKGRKSILPGKQETVID
jgi:hypothetical protein